MQTDEFERVAPQIKEVSDYVFLHILGEPTLHPQLDHIFDICLKNKLWVNLTTNGTHADRIPVSHAALRKVSFSLHSAQANNLDIDTYAKPIKNAARELVCHKKIVEYKFWTGGDLHDADTYIGKLFFALSPSDDIHISVGETFVWPHEGLQTDERKFCMGLRDQCGILCDGTVVPCCLDGGGDIDLGNVFCDSLANIISGGKATQLYDGFSSNKAVFPLCRQCDFYDMRSSSRFTSK